jgi:hypothetical protein
VHGAQGGPAARQAGLEACDTSGTAAIVSQVSKPASGGEGLKMFSGTGGTLVLRFGSYNGVSGHRKERRTIVFLFAVIRVYSRLVCRIGKRNF